MIVVAGEFLNDEKFQKVLSSTVSIDETRAQCVIALRDDSIARYFAGGSRDETHRPSSEALTTEVFQLAVDGWIASFPSTSSKSK